MTPQQRFHKAFGRDPDAAESRRFEQIRDRLSIDDEDALWGVAMLLEMYVRLYPEVASEAAARAVRQELGALRVSARFSGSGAVEPLGPTLDGGVAALGALSVLAALSSVVGASLVGMSAANEGGGSAVVSVVRALALAPAGWIAPLAFAWPAMGLGSRWLLERAAAPARSRERRAASGKLAGLATAYVGWFALLSWVVA